MSLRIFSKITMYAMVAFLLTACNVSFSALTPSPEPTIALTATPANTVQSPTENTPLATPTNTPISALPISLSNFQNLASLYQWNIASDIVKIIGIAFSPLYRNVPAAALRDPKLYGFLTLVDAIREGRAREREIAIQELTSRIDSIRDEWS